jgi:hypothetical protein
MSVRKNKIVEKFKRLNQVALSCEDKDHLMENQDSALFREYALTTPKGYAFYKSLNDELLLQILKIEADRLGHSPSQKEVFWIYRDYIKARFHKWPYALKAAGLSKSAGSGGKSLELQEQEKERYETLLEKIRAKGVELGRIPHPKEMPEVCDELQNFNLTWNQIITEAGLTWNFFEKKTVFIMDDLDQDCCEILEKIKFLAKKLGRAPLKNEVDPDERAKLIEKCGNWRNTLFQIGLEPVRRIHPFFGVKIYSEDQPEKKHRYTLHDCYYRILDPDEQTIADLSYLKQVCEILNRKPEKSDISPAIRKRLQSACGSWANALFQIGLENSDTHT